MAGTGKDGKEAKDGKDKKIARSEGIDSDSRALLRRMADELSALRDDVDALKNAPISPAVETESPASAKGKGKKNAAETRATVGDSTLWQSADDAEVARIGYAFSSVPKIALIRALLREGPLPAAKLGEMTGLTTGSLYHHLRELTHADVLVSEGRNRFALTERGQQLALLLFTQAAHSVHS